MWRVARGAALSLDGRMLVNKWSEGIDVTLGANGVLGRTRPKEVRLEGTVRVMTIRARLRPSSRSRAISTGGDSRYRFCVPFHPGLFKTHELSNRGIAF